MKNLISLIALLAITLTAVAQPQVQTSIQRYSGTPTREDWPGTIAVDAETGRVYSKRTAQGVASGWVSLDGDWKEVQMDVFGNATNLLTTYGAGGWTFDNAVAVSNVFSCTLPADWDANTNNLRIKMTLVPPLDQPYNTNTVTFNTWGALAAPTYGLSNLTAGTLTGTIAVTPGASANVPFTLTDQPALYANGTPVAGSVVLMRVVRSADTLTNNLFLISRPILQYKPTAAAVAQWE